MDAGHIMVGLLSIGVIIFLVLIEINSRRNEARLKAQAQSKTAALSGASTVGQLQPQGGRKAG